MWAGGGLGVDCASTFPCRHLLLAWGEAPAAQQSEGTIRLLAVYGLNLVQSFVLMDSLKVRGSKRTTPYVSCVCI